MKNYKTLFITTLLNATIGIFALNTVAHASPENLLKPMLKPVITQQASMKRTPIVKITAKEIKASKGKLPRNIISQLKKQGVRLNKKEEMEISKLTNNIVGNIGTGNAIRGIKIRIDIDLKEKTIAIKIIF